MTGETPTLFCLGPIAGPAADSLDLCPLCKSKLVSALDTNPDLKLDELEPHSTTANAPAESPSATAS
jgi:hypothetical protein